MIIAADLAPQGLFDEAPIGDKAMPGEQSQTDYKGYTTRVYQEATFGGTAPPGWGFNIYKPGKPLSAHRDIEHSVPAAIVVVPTMVEGMFPLGNA